MRLVWLLLLVSVALPAQRIEGRFTAGATSFVDDTILNHVTLGGGVRIYVSHRWSVEPEYLHMRSSDGFWKDRDHLLWGNVAFDFRRREHLLVPYWFAGPGLIRHSYQYGSISTATTEAAFGTGAGLKMMCGRVLVGPQFRLGVADGIFAEVTGSVGIVLSGN